MLLKGQNEVNMYKIICYRSVTYKVAVLHTHVTNNNNECIVLVKFMNIIRRNTQYYILIMMLITMLLFVLLLLFTLVSLDAYTNKVPVNDA